MHPKCLEDYGLKNRRKTKVGFLGGLLFRKYLNCLIQKVLFFYITLFSPGKRVVYRDSLHPRLSEYKVRTTV